jgi:hypothetical protein
MNSTATILEDPVLLRKPQGDMAAFKMGPAYWAKTMFVRNCDVSRKTLRRWADLNLEFPDRISCENFSQAVLELKPTVTILPPTYSWLPTFDKTYKSQKPVILHPMEGL